MYATASASYAVLGVLLALFRRNNPLGLSLLTACVISASWAGIVALSYVVVDMPVTAVQVSELARDACWLFVLLQLLGLQRGGSPWSIGKWRWRRLFILALAAALGVIVIRPLLLIPPSADGLHSQLVLGLWLILALLGLMVIEQLYRNSTQNARWSIKFLCLGTGTLVAYDFFMYAEALLFRELDAELWQARGLINTLAMPFLGVAIARNSYWRTNLQISHQVAFHTVTLMGAGLYLMGMAAAGYAIRQLGSSWGGVLQMGFLAAAAALLLVLLFSGQLRAQIQVFLGKHFFSYRYDYREEWLKFTQALASLNEDVAEGIIRIMAPLARSPAGLLWANSDEDQPLHLLAHWQMQLQQPGASLGQLPDWLQKTDWVIDLDEWRRSPDSYKDLQLPAWLQEDEQIWLVIPLIFRDRLQAVLMLKKTALKSSLNWEDRDLLKTAGRQAATHLAQHLASKALVEARQFDAFNRLSAYVVHDLKNILAQQSLIVSNAAKHRDNSAFVDDMISTVENSVKRMQRLMDQMRSGIRSAPAEKTELIELLHAVIDNRKDVLPAPRADWSVKECFVAADSERLSTVFNHLIQNAQEATDAGGEVIVQLKLDADSVSIDIEDTGIGMTEEFIRDRLYRPFESTKGLTGMGIGAFESREYIRQLGGDIRVTSNPGRGTTFHVVIPTISTDRDRYDQESEGS